MTVYGHILPGAASLANWAARTNITEKAKQKLKVVDWLRTHNNNISLTARHFGLDRKTVHRWRDKFNKVGMLGLNDRSHKPKNVRKPTIDWKIVAEIVKIRKQYPAWSKYKIKRILTRENMIVSASTIGRVLKRKGLINNKVSKKRTKAAKNPKKRFPKGFKIASPGDMVQMDTKYVNLIGGKRIYQFTAIDVLTKRRALKYYSSLASKNGADFLRYCLKKFPFLVKNIQTDNGPEFLKEFDKTCKELNMPHYFILPRTPKQNTYVEASHLADKMSSICRETLVMTLNQWKRNWNNGNIPGIISDLMKRLTT